MGKIAVHIIVFLMGAFAILSCWLMWRKAKDKRDQEDIDKRLEHIQMVQIPPVDLARMKERIMRVIRLEQCGGKHYLTTEEPEFKPCKRGSRCSQDKP